MKMFVANASSQNYTFTYRKIGDGKPRTVYIGPMSQSALPDIDLGKPEIDYIIEQHEPYGFASLDDVIHGTVKRKFTRLCYSIDKQISSIAISALFNSNRLVQDEQGKTLRKEMAIASNEAVVKQLAVQKQQGEIHPDTDFENFEVVVQEQPLTDFNRSESEMVNEGIRVEPRPGTQKAEQVKSKKARRSR